MSFYFFNIKTIGHICLSGESAIVIHAFITNKPNYCNSLLYGLPDFQIQRLKKIKNTAAYILTTFKRDISLRFWNIYIGFLFSFHSIQNSCFKLFRHTQGRRNVLFSGGAAQKINNLQCISGSCNQWRYIHIHIHTHIYFGIWEGGSRIFHFIFGIALCIERRKPWFI